MKATLKKTAPADRELSTALSEKLPSADLGG